MSTRLCGPSNAAKALVSLTDRDSSEYQTHLATNPQNEAQSFRNVDQAHTAANEQDYTAFLSSASSLPMKPIGFDSPRRAMMNIQQAGVPVAYLMEGPTENLTSPVAEARAQGFAHFQVASQAKPFVELQFNAQDLAEDFAKFQLASQARPGVEQHHPDMQEYLQDFAKFQAASQAKPVEQLESAQVNNFAMPHLPTFAMPHPAWGPGPHMAGHPASMFGHAYPVYPHPMGFPTHGVGSAPAPAPAPAAQVKSEPEIDAEDRSIDFWDAVTSNFCRGQEADFEAEMASWMAAHGPSASGETQVAAELTREDWADIQANMESIADEMDAAAATVPVEEQAAKGKAVEEAAQKPADQIVDPVDDDLVASAKKVLASVADNDSDKFRNSAFLALMRHIASGKAVLSGGDLVERDTGKSITRYADASDEAAAPVQE